MGLGLSLWQKSSRTSDQISHTTSHPGEQVFLNEDKKELQKGIFTLEFALQLGVKPPRLTPD